MTMQPYTIQHRAYWKIIVSLGLASLFIFATMYSFQSILPVFTAAYDIPISYASLTMSLTTIGLIVGLITIGFLSDRQGRVHFIYLSVCLTTVSLFIIPIAPSFFIIVCLRFVQGFLFSGLLGAALAYMAEEIEPGHFGFATTLYIACNSLGGMIGRFVTSYLAEAYSWQTTLYIIGCFGIGVSLLVFILLPKSRYFVQSTDNFFTDVKGFLVHLKNPMLLLLFGLGIVLQTAFTGMWTFLPFHLIEAPYDLSLKNISYFYLAYGFGVIGAPIAGWLSKKYSFRSIRIAGVIILSVGMIITLGQSLYIISVGLAFICLGFFVSHAITTATVSQTAVHHKGSASSLYLVSYYIGVAAGSSLLTPIWDAFAWTGIIVFCAGLPLVYLGMVLGLQKRSPVQ